MTVLHGGPQGYQDCLQKGSGLLAERGGCHADNVGVPPGFPFRWP